MKEYFFLHKSPFIPSQYRVNTDYNMSETEKCGFCFAEYFEMIDPRQMACGHVFCLPCMQEHYENPQGVECAFKHCR